MFTRFSFLLLILLTSLAQGEEVVVSDDGKQIRLNDDGTWVQVSQDRFATNERGERIRLRADGTWNVMARSSEDIVRTEAGPGLVREGRATLQDEPIIYLKSVEILRREIKRAKSTHAEKRMRYTVGVDNKTEQSLDVDLSGDFRATTNRGGDYELLSVNGPQEVAPGAQAEIVVTVQDAPSWFGVKYLSLEVPPNVLGNAAQRLLNKNMNEVKRLQVDDF